MRRRAAFFGLLFCFVELPALSDVEAGLRAYREADYTTALIEWQPLAEHGDAAAQAWLGTMYRMGQGVAQDYAEAVRWYRKAADQGDASAQNSLGFAYGHGKGIPQDQAEAARWYRKAADQGMDLAENNLGAMYSQGQGVPEDKAEAARWYRKAADQGFAPAQNNLGILYWTGRGVAKNYVQAYLWLNLASAVGEASAIKNRDELEKSMTSEQIGDAQALTSKWKPQPASVDSDREPGPAPTEEPTSPTLVSMGTGFFVTSEGYAVTNFHVVDGCSALLTKRAGRPQALSFIARDPSRDLALLKLTDSDGSHATFREGSGPRLGETVLAAGYPLRGLLASSLNVTVGNISALAGIGDDTSRYQISAPVQPGNSGGPVFDQAGNVVGVVVEKLNAVYMAKETGDIPQNVNFAIKGSVSNLF